MVSTDSCYREALTFVDCISGYEQSIIQANINYDKEKQMSTHDKELSRREVTKQVHKQVGRLACPAPKLFKDKKKYSRKAKHKGVHYNESPFLLSATNNSMHIFSIQPAI
jgi:hypothetical protein